MYHIPPTPPRLPLEALSIPGSGGSQFVTMPLTVGPKQEGLEPARTLVNQKKSLYHLHASEPCGHCCAVEQIRRPYCASRFPSSDHGGVGSATDRLDLRIGQAPYESAIKFDEGR